jgi:hypothetical protein
MPYVKRLIQKNIDRGRHWLPFLPSHVRDLVTLIPSLFCLGKDMAGIYGHTTCTQSQYRLLNRILGRKPDIPVGKQPYRVLIESLIAIPRPDIAKPGSVNILLIVVPKTGISLDTINTKCSEVRNFFQRKDVSLNVHVLEGPFPHRILYDVLRVGIVLAGRHPADNVEEFPDYSFFAGELPDYITDEKSFSVDEWDPYQAFLDSEVRDIILHGNYHPYLRLTSVNPFILPYLPVLTKYEEGRDADRVLLVRHCLDALFSRFGPTREGMAELKKAWGFENSTPSPSSLTFSEAIRIRKKLLPIGEKELPIFSWPPVTLWAIPKASLICDGESWSLAEAGQFSHKYAWVVLVWAAIAGIIGHRTIVKAPRQLLLKRQARNLLENLLQEITMGADMIVPEDTHQGSVRVENGRFYFSQKPFAILEPGKKLNLMLFESIKKKALLDDSDLHLGTFKNKDRAGI